MRGELASSSFLYATQTRIYMRPVCSSILSHVPFRAFKTGESRSFSYVSFTLRLSLDFPLHELALRDF